MKKIICILLSACLILGLAACTDDRTPAVGSPDSSGLTEEQIPEAAESADASDVVSTEEPAISTEESAASTEEPTVQTEDTVTSGEEYEDDSLVIFRQSMVETPQIFAAAYFGYVPQNEDPFVVMRQAAPQLCEDLPFLLAVQKENISGDFGHLFCIVPADENSTVAVNRRPWNPETESYEEPEVLYRSEEGSPILVMCPNEDWIPDTELIITDPKGNVRIWSPYIDPDNRVTSLLGDNGESLIFDFTAYDELSEGN